SRSSATGRRGWSRCTSGANPRGSSRARTGRSRDGARARGPGPTGSTGVTLAAERGTRGHGEAEDRVLLYGMRERNAPLAGAVSCVRGVEHAGGGAGGAPEPARGERAERSRARTRRRGRVGRGAGPAGGGGGEGGLPLVLGAGRIRLRTRRGRGARVARARGRRAGDREEHVAPPGGGESGGGGAAHAVRVRRGVGHAGASA